MRLFKIILVFFAIYFIRRFWQFYKVVEKRGQELHAQEDALKEQQKASDGKVVDAEYKVIDR
jgi:hypothetical protein